MDFQSPPFDLSRFASGEATEVVFICLAFGAFKTRVNFLELQTNPGVERLGLAALKANSGKFGGNNNCF